MSESTSSLRLVRPAILVLVVALLSGLTVPPRTLAADPSPGASGAPASAAPIASEPPETMCDSLADLRTYVGFVQSQSLSEDGILPILVGALASLSEARTLLPLVGDAYRPAVQGLVSSLEDLVRVARLGRQGTLGSELTRLGDAISQVGVALDALSAALREPCPSVAPTTSGAPAPVVSASPAG